MNLEFKIYNLKEDSKLYPMVCGETKKPNEFIIVGEEDEYYRAQQLDVQGICLIGGLNIKESAYAFKKEDLILKPDGYIPSCETCEMDIPKKYLTMDIIEEIQKLNS